MIANVHRTVLRRRAVRLLQDDSHPLYLFALRASELLEIADISRLARDDASALIGYQRPEVKRHVENIVTYLDANRRVLFPHALILALDSSTRFKRSRGTNKDIEESVAQGGTLTIRRPGSSDAKPAWIVDGQQRALALSRCKRGDLPVPVAAFVADDLATQREQFLLVNTTRPLPLGLVSELLPTVSSVLPPSLAVRKAPAALVEFLSSHSDSPFNGLIRRASADGVARKSHVVSDTALVKTLADSLTQASGCLFPYRNLSSEETDYPSVIRLLLVYWSAVREVFPNAWGKPPTESRLMHSIGLRAMGKLMDRVMANVDANDAGAAARVVADLRRVEPVCRWTSGEWEDLGIPWNRLEMTQTHLRLLSSTLARAHAGAR